MGQAGFISVAKYDGHIISYEYKEGFEDIEQIKPISGDSIFNIASLSKQFTAFAILILEEQRKLSLNDSVLKYLPELGEYARDITLQHLIYHTSGLKDYLELALNRGVSYTDDLFVEDILEDIYRQDTKEFKAGTQFQYSNTGYFLLAQVVEKVSKKKFSEFLNEYVFLPLRMFSTSVVDAYPTNRKSVIGYKQIEDDKYEVSVSPWKNIGDSGVYSSVNDLLKWGEKFNSCIVGTKQIINKMLSVLPNEQLNGNLIIDYEPYAFGLGQEHFMGEKLYDHSGAWLGIATHFMRFVDIHLTVIVLSNNEDLDVESIAYKIAAQVLK